jgi:hypothetical protein
MQSIQQLAPKHRPLTWELGLPLGGAEYDSFGSGNAASGVCHRSVTRIGPTRHGAAALIIAAACSSKVRGGE